MGEIDQRGAGEFGRIARDVAGTLPVADHPEAGGPIRVLELRHCASLMLGEGPA
jgi:hypothetical protein